MLNKYIIFNSLICISAGRGMKLYKTGMEEVVSSCFVITVCKSSL